MIRKYFCPDLSALSYQWIGQSKAHIFIYVVFFKDLPRSFHRRWLARCHSYSLLLWYFSVSWVVSDHLFIRDAVIANDHNSPHRQQEITSTFRIVSFSTSFMCNLMKNKTKKVSLFIIRRNWKFIFWQTFITRNIYCLKEIRKGLKQQKP